MGGRALVGDAELSSSEDAEVPGTTLIVAARARLQGEHSQAEGMCVIVPACVQLFSLALGSIDPWS